MPPRDTPEQMAATTADLPTFGYRCTGANLWLSPDGLRVLDVATALAEVTQLLAEHNKENTK